MDTIIVTAAIIKRKDKILISKRKLGTHLGGLWEFPGGKLESAEDPRDGIVREIEEELGFSIKPGQVYEVLYHKYPEKNILLIVYWAEVVRGVPQAIDCEEFAWVDSSNYQDYEYAPADKILIENIFSKGLNKVIETDG